VGAVDALPHLYHAADLTLLPSVWEAFGLVVVESLAAGTPVVGVNHGGVPDILLGHEFDATGQQGVGLLFDADINIMSSENILNLVSAIRKSLLVCRSPDISTRCQVRAEAFSWLSLGQYYTMIYHQVLNDEIPCFESHSALESQLLPSLAHVENKASKRMNSSNTDTVTLSVIVPTHGRKLLIKRLLEALSRQSMRDEMEVIIIHNYTNDGSEHVCIDWTLAQSFPVRYFRKNFSGPAASRDFGAHAARGDLLAFIDDDCQPIPTWARAGVSGFTLPDVGLVQGRTQPMPGQKRCLFEKTVSVIHPSIFYETCNIFYRRSSFLSVGGFSPEFITRFYGEDTDLGWKVTLSGYQKHFVPEALVYHEVFQVTIMQWLKEP
ncbi:MAG: glycosyltransferase, partial [Gammaproteobacteria bacterium]